MYLNSLIEIQNIILKKTTVHIQINKTIVVVREILSKTLKLGHKVLNLKFNNEFVFKIF